MRVLNKVLNQGAFREGPSSPSTSHRIRLLGRAKLLRLRECACISFLPGNGYPVPVDWDGQ